MSSIAKARKPYTLLAAVAALMVALAPRAGAHDVPNEVTVSGFVRPEGQTLTLLLRVPMKSLLDVDIPTYTTGEAIVRNSGNAGERRIRIVPLPRPHPAQRVAFRYR